VGLPRYYCKNSGNIKLFVRTYFRYSKFQTYITNILLHFLLLQPLIIGPFGIFQFRINFWKYECWWKLVGLLVWRIGPSQCQYQQRTTKKQEKRIHTCTDWRFFNFNSIYLTFIIVAIVTLEQVISLTIIELPIKFYITIKFTLSTPIKYIMFTI
jgi:hypothetical protein